MRHTLTIFKWEMGKIISNWRRTMVVFLMPAVLLLGALNVFPLLINYLSTGHLQSSPVLVVDAPDSFIDFVESDTRNLPYSYSFWTMDEVEEMLEDDDDYFDKKIRDEGVRIYYEQLSKGGRFHKLKNTMYVGYNADNYTSYVQAEQFLLNVKSEYASYLFDTLGEEYKDVGGGERWTVDGFNPYTYVLQHRADANYGAARTIPAIMILLMYYCVYSLAGEILASSRESGFLTKVYLTPISELSLLMGKMLTVVSVSTICAVLTYGLMFFSSWLNHTNNAFSLLPFGMLLLPGQLFFVLLTLVITSFLMCGLCFGIVFKLRRMEDVLMNLQIPLVLLIVEFFGLMFRSSAPLLIEYLIPIHNSVILIRDIFLGTFHIGNALITLRLNALLTALMLAFCVRNTDGMIHISQESEEPEKTLTFWERIRMRRQL